MLAWFRAFALFAVKRMLATDQNLVMGCDKQNERDDETIIAVSDNPSSVQ